MSHNPSQEEIESHLCNNGCGQKAKFYSYRFKTFRCSKKPVDCPAVGNKISEANKKRWSLIQIGLLG